MEEGRNWCEGWELSTLVDDFDRKRLSINLKWVKYDFVKPFFLTVSLRESTRVWFLRTMEWWTKKAADLFIPQELKESRLV